MTDLQDEEIDAAEGEERNPGGRPTKYKPEYAEKARQLCEQGATIREVAEFFKVHESTVNNWSHEHVEFFTALKTGRETADIRVEQSLYRRAMGYSHDSMHVSNYQGQVTLTPIVEHYPPDTTAAIFWLKNRKPDEWRDKQQHEHTGKDGGPIESRIERDEATLHALTGIFERMARMGQAGSLAPGMPNGAGVAALGCNGSNGHRPSVDAGEDSGGPAES